MTVRAVGLTLTVIIITETGLCRELTQRERMVLGQIEMYYLESMSFVCLHRQGKDQLTKKGPNIKLGPQGEKKIIGQDPRKDNTMDSSQHVKVCLSLGVDALEFERARRKGVVVWRQLVHVGVGLDDKKTFWSTTYINYTQTAYSPTTTPGPHTASKPTSTTRPHTAS